MVATATRTIKENLDRIPDEDGRTKVAIICFDTSLYFFSMPVGVLIDQSWSLGLTGSQAGTTESSMLVVSDIDLLGQLVQRPLTGSVETRSSSF